MNNKINIFISILIGLGTLVTLFFFLDDIVFYLRNILNFYIQFEALNLLMIIKWIAITIIGCGMAVFCYYFVFLRLPKAYKSLSKKKKRASILFSVIFSLYITLSLILSAGDLLIKSFFVWYNIVLFFLLLLLFFTIFIIFVAVDKFESCNEFENYNKKEKTSIKRLFLYSLSIMIIWIIYLLLFLPANASSDTFYQWSLIHSNPMILDNWHPLIHSMFYKVITYIWDSMIALALVQILILSLIYGYGLYSLEKTGFKKKWLWFIAFFVGISPLNGFFVNTLWKDIFYSGFVLLLIIYVFNIIVTKGLWLKSKGNIILFSFVLFLTATFRSNGIVPAILVNLFLFIFICVSCRKYIRQVIVISILFVVAFFGYSIGVMKVFNIGQPPFSNGIGLPLQVVAGVINNGTITEEERNFFRKIKTDEDWRSYNCYLADNIKNVTPINNAYLEKNIGDFLKKTIAVSLKNPRQAIVAYLNQTDLLWSYIDKGRFSTFLYNPNNGNKIVNAFKKGSPGFLAQYPHGFDYINIEIINHRINILAPMVVGLYLFTEILLRVTLLYNPAFYLALLIFLSFAFMVKRGRNSILPILFLMITIFGNVLSLYMSIVAHDLRYAYPILFTMPFLVAALCVNLNKGGR